MQRLIQQEAIDSLDVNNGLNSSLVVRFDGLIHDGRVSGRDEIFDKRYGLATSVSIQPTDLINLTLDYYHLNTNSLPAWGFPYDGANRRPYDVDRSNFYGVKDWDFQKTTANIGTLRLDYDTSKTLVMNAQFRHGVTTNHYLLTVPGIREVDPEQTTSTTSRGSVVPPGKVLYDEFGCAGVCVNVRVLNRDFRNTFIGGQVNFQKDIDLNNDHHTLITGLELTKECDPRFASPLKTLLRLMRAVWETGSLVLSAKQSRYSCFRPYNRKCWKSLTEDVQEGQMEPLETSP